MANDKYKTRVGINVVEKVISLKEQDQEFLTNKTILSYLGGVSKEFVRDLRESGELPYYKIRNTIFYKISDVRKMVERHRITIMDYNQAVPSRIIWRRPLMVRQP